MHVKLGFNKKMTNENNPWKYVARRDVSNNPYFKKETQEAKADDTLPEEKKQDFNIPASSKIDGTYQFIEDNPYAKTVHELQKTLTANSNNTHPFIKDKNTKIYRPLTFKENIEAKINNYETLNTPNNTPRSDEEREKLFKVYLDSCTGIAYQKGTTKFKINPVCEELITIDKKFKDEFKTIDFASFAGFALDSKDDIYNKLLTKNQFLNHRAYNALFNNDASLMNNYWSIVNKLTKKDNLMAFWVRQNTSKDELRALCVDSLGGNSVAVGNVSLDDFARFLLVAPSQKKSGKK